MKIPTAFVISTLVAPASTASEEELSSQELRLGQRTYSYACEDGHFVQVTYITTGAENEGHPVFAVLRHGDDVYGLSEAVSASGARYIGHSGLNTASGLEWWTKGDHGTLSTFEGDDARNTIPLLKDCRAVS